MNTKLILATAAMLAFSGAGLAQTNDYHGHRTVYYPGTVNTPGVLSVGLAVCDRATPASPLFCESGGFGAFFTNLTGPEPNTTDSGNGFSNGDDLATGTCRVEDASRVPPDGPYYFVCGTDRDDDGFVTNSDGAGPDAACTGDPNNIAGGSSDCADGFDDDFVSGDNDNFEVPFCFARDRRDTSLDSDFNPGNDWDDIVVFVGFNVGTSPSVGTLDVYLDGVSSNASCTRSEHSHGLWLA